ncbi:uncharacterized protein [Asterias amurensis]|uniref:uncharacterized protein n=1 Tax=Asterias amurensis TaxID=7602 RepID=UPI003AB7C91E
MVSRCVMLVAVMAMVGLAMSSCPNVPWREHGKPYLTLQKFPSRPLTRASTYCQNCGMQLCTLAQMQEAYINGFRSQRWGMFEKLGHDMRASDCTKYVARKECYAVLNSPGASPTGIIPFTPRVASVQNAWCCGK